ncbi:unnamed protein product [Litomosoides sigmodontis]|uniref:PID domain-containing protein n=1 Tax=Litomosoides sigmodontis TaxID=42156 RepID=A0A3P6TZC4_LITSI|nr:unnamed protein product [Litomosoides sigmodontis]
MNQTIGFIGFELYLKNALRSTLRITYESVQMSFKYEKNGYLKDQGYNSSDWSRCRPVFVDINEHGLQLTDESDRMVLDRIALFHIVQCVSYENGFGHFCVVFLVQKPLNKSMQCYVFQTSAISVADDVCKQLGEIFNVAVK